MADRLQFRGYKNYEIPGQPLVERELMFDLDRDTLVLGQNKAYVLTEMTGYTRSEVEALIAEGVEGATQGLDGVQGPAGPAGAVGPQGPVGPAGQNGDRGLTGPQGIQGIQGIQGLVGPEGPDGPQGTQGPAGVGLNIVGTIGQAGPPSSNGSAAGDVLIDSNGIGWRWSGSSWASIGPIQGPQGPQGVKGATGDQGIQGIQGLTGPKGDTGDIGATGPAGAAGAIGLTGPQGPTGPIGPRGPQGLPGAAGPPGESGGGGGSISVSSFPSNNPNEGDLWFNNTKGRLFVYMRDNDSAQWVETSPSVKGEDGKGYISGAYDPSTGKVTLQGSNGNANVVTGDLRGKDGINGKDGKDATFTGGTVSGVTDFVDPVNIRNQMVFYEASGARLIGTGEFDISGNSSIKLSTGGTERMNIANDRIVFKRELKCEVTATASNSANAYLTSGGLLKRSTSSARYKRDIELMSDEDALRFLDKARPVAYFQKDDSDCGGHLGFIAEEMHDVEQRFVDYDLDGRPDAVQYGSIVSVLTKICQLQEERIKALEDKLNGN